MVALRDPDSGCPWDQEQTFKTIASYTLEEAYEVVDAIARDDLENLRDELGDLLLQVVYHARMAEEVGVFAFDDVVTARPKNTIRSKLSSDDCAVVLFFRSCSIISISSIELELILMQFLILIFLLGRKPVRQQALLLTLQKAETRTMIGIFH